MEGNSVVKFQSPASLQLEVVLPNAGKVKGMAIEKGVTLIVGGGFHGNQFSPSSNISPDGDQ